MPENQLPPTWGPAYDERDLDALLDGELASLPEALLPLAGTLVSLHARPVQVELAGEAAARAVFRHFAPDAGPRALGAEHGTVPHTLVLPRRPEDRPQRHTPRHRRRRAAGGIHRPTTIVVGAAAAAAVVVAGVALAVTGLLPGPFRQLSHFGRASTNPSALATATAQASPTSGLESGSSAKVPDIRPTPSDSSTSGTTTSGELCRQYYAFFDSPEPKSAWTEELAVWRKLDKLAGGPWKVFSYCLPDMDYGSWGSHETTQTPPQGNYPGPSGNGGSSGNGSGGKESSSTGKGTGSGNSSVKAPAPGPSSLSTPSQQATSSRPGHSHPIDPNGTTSGLSDSPS